MIPEDLEVGKTYKVDATDCCVSAKFTSRRKKKKIIVGDSDDPEIPGYVDGLIFENGVTVDGHGVEYIEVEDDTRSD